MEMRIAKLIATKGGSGSSTFRATLPARWIRKMGLGEDSKDIKIELIDNKIIISKECLEMLEKVKVEIGYHEYLELEGKKIKVDETQTKYEVRRRNTKVNGTEEEYKIKVERIKEKWDFNNHVINILITKEYYKEDDPFISITSTDISNMIEYENKKVEEIKDILGGN